MILSRGLAGLGDFASTEKARARAQKADKPQVSIAKTLAPGFSAQLAHQQKFNNLLKMTVAQQNLAKYNADLAAGNINPNFVKPPVAPTDAQVDAARATYLGKKAPVALLTSSAPSTSTPALLSPTALSNIFGNKSITKALPGATPVATTPAQQAAAAIVAAQPDLATQQSALTSTGGGGGGGGGGDIAPTDTTDATLPDDTTAPTGWAGLSTGAKVGVVVGVVAVAGGIYFMVRKRH